MTRAVTRLQIYPDQRYTTYDVEARLAGHTDLPLFLELSVQLTGFSRPEIQSTGNVEHLFEELGATLGAKARHALLTAGPPPALLEDRLFGPLAKNVVRMWYLGQWQRLPDDVMAALRKSFGEVDTFGRNFNRVISARAYREGLVWPAVGANPPAANQPGFASWAEPPRA